MKEILVFSFEELIDAPIDFVFTCLNKDEHVEHWNELIVRSIYQKHSEDELEVGSTYQTVQKVGNKEYTFEAELTDYKPPFRATIKTETKEGVSITRYQLSEETEGTHLKVQASITPSNIKYKVLTKLFGWLSRFLYKDIYQQFVNYVHEHNDRLWDVYYESEDGKYSVIGDLHLNEDNTWDVLLSHDHHDVYNLLKHFDYEWGEDRVHLFRADSFKEAEAGFFEWVETIWIPLLQKKYGDEYPVA
ncbi:SRPBCC domain-containing protein [Alkalicoccobacillus murimartini]|uniref:Uncharacterized protein YndB with AHSA1/START domain n=1 Tax=Alkalicoccobacillus murimartini TaxID=171685 RepID=A0ABT9YLM5_9BACI|nr:SRPBCC domain-containing protein [Alkalicoccobacillus murimartini]MDQ0208780.1 uncharacterized protein YndB with AHSA1/START domain [Alkalicoccobacillus murimartini]